MSTLEEILSTPPPKSLSEALAHWPEDPARQYNHSPRDWRDQIFYFLLPDRFSDGKEKDSRLLDADLSTPEGLAKIKSKRTLWNKWQRSGADRYQGGTLTGILSKLGYLKNLGVTTLWVGPILRQRVEEDSYHGYGIHDFLDVDPRFGTRKDLVDLVTEAHKLHMYVVLDVIFNHSGCNWLYDATAGNAFQPPYLASGSYSPIWPRNGYGGPISSPNPSLGPDDSVWPRELQEAEHYLRAGSGNLGSGSLSDDNAEFRRTDFCSLRKMNLGLDSTMTALVLSYHYWIALADLDGFRIDTFKHVTFEQARTFANAIKEYAEHLGKDDFFLVAEAAGGDETQHSYLELTGRNLNACLDIGGNRELLCNIGKGLDGGRGFFKGYNHSNLGMPSHRLWGSQHLSIVNDHDHVFGPKVRYAADASNDHQATTATAMQLFAPGIPCLYYGTEQGLAGGAEPDQRSYLTGWGSHDCLLREAMFGPEKPRAHGWDGTQGKLDTELPGFGPHGTSGWHVFNPKHPLYRRIAAMTALRTTFKPLRRGRVYQRQIAFMGLPFGYYGAGELLAWSRLFDDQEVLVVMNTHGTQNRGAKVVVDAKLTVEGMQVLLNTDPGAPPSLKVGAWLPTQTGECGRFVALDQELLRPSEVLVLGNRSAVESARHKWRP